MRGQEPSGGLPFRTGGWEAGVDPQAQKAEGHAKALRSDTCSDCPQFVAQPGTGAPWYFARR